MQYIASLITDNLQSVSIISKPLVKKWPETQLSESLSSVAYFPTSVFMTAQDTQAW